MTLYKNSTKIQTAEELIGDSTGCMNIRITGMEC